MEWQPIETAPLSRIPILLYCPGIRNWHRKLGSFPIVVGVWEGDERAGSWYADIADIDPGWESTGPWLEYEPLRPSHWMPLPAFPEDPLK